MTRLIHPFVRDAFVEAPSEDLLRWLEAGWLLDEEPTYGTEPDPEPTGEDHDHSEENA